MISGGDCVHRGLHAIGADWQRRDGFNAFEI